MANRGQPPPKSILLPLVARSRGAWGPPPRDLRIEDAGPGQESVWDYPRPPWLEDVPEVVRVVFGGVVLAETDRAVRVLETAGAPVYYLPLDSFRDGALMARDCKCWIKIPQKCWRKIPHFSVSGISRACGWRLRSWVDGRAFSGAAVV